MNVDGFRRERDFQAKEAKQDGKCRKNVASPDSISEILKRDIYV